jgi:hypothetical protein
LALSFAAKHSSWTSFPSFVTPSREWGSHRLHTSLVDRIVASGKKREVA